MALRRKASVGVGHGARICSDWLTPEQPNHSVTQSILGLSIAQLTESVVLVEVGRGPELYCAECVHFGAGFPSPSLEV